MRKLLIAVLILATACGARVAEQPLVSSPASEYQVPNRAGIGIPGWDFQIGTATGTEAYDLNALVVVKNATASDQVFVLGLLVDGAVLPGSQQKMYMPDADSTTSLAYSFSFNGLSLGPHSMTIYATGAPRGSAIYIEPQSYATLRRTL